VLFIGNSLTAGMPGNIEKIAKSKGDSLYFIHTIGAPSLDTVDNYTKSIINSENWDYVVVQYNSKIRKVNEVIKQNSACTQTVVYMMWGWENGNNSTLNYFEQQDRFRTIYKNMADEIKGICAPTGMSWNTVRTEKPWIYLYGGDNYHPNDKGVYLNACTFYSVFFEKSPEGATYTGLPDSTASYFQKVAANVVLDSLDTWNINTFVPNNSPKFISPLNNSITESSLVTFEWDKDIEMDSYNLQVAIDKDFNEIIFSEMNTNENIYTRDLDVYNTQVFARLSGNYTTENYSVCKTSWRNLEFKTPYGGPILIAPEDNITCLDREIDFYWEPNLNADSYIIQFASDSSFSDIQFQGDIYDNFYTHNFYSNKNTVYWRVQEFQGIINDKWSKTRTLTLKDIGPNQLIPDNNSINIPNDNYILTWNNFESGSNQKYNLQISNDNLFNKITKDVVGLTANKFVFKSTNFGTKYYWRVQRDIGDCPSAWSEIHNFKTKLKATELLLPANKDKLNNPDMITLIWDSYYNNSNHNVVISTDSSFKQIILSKSGIQNSQIEIQGLMPLTKYFWKVKTNVGNDFSEESKIWEFTTSKARPNTPVLISPENESIHQSIDIGFKWQSVAGADQYVLEFSENREFIGTTNVYTDIKKNEFELSELEYNKDYFWRVKTVIDGIESSWSNRWSFSTKTGNLNTKVELLSPKDNETNLNKLVICTWRVLIDADSYTLQLSNNLNFDKSNLVFDNQVVNNSQTIDQLLPGSKYYWRVRGENPSGSGQWSDIRTFTTKDDLSSVINESYYSRVYPNPSRGDFQIESEFSFDKIRIRNIEGELVDSYDVLITNEYYLNLSNKLSSGYYLVELINDKEMVTIKIILE